MTRSRSIERLGHLPGWPLLLDPDAAATYAGITVCEFGHAVQRGELPRPRLLAGKLLWSRRDLEARFDQSGSPLRPDFDPIAAA